MVNGPGVAFLALFLALVAGAAILARIRSDRLQAARASSPAWVSNVRRWLVLPLAWGVVSIALMTAPWWPGCRLPSETAAMAIAGFVGTMASLVLALLLEGLHREGATVARLATTMGVSVGGAFLAWSVIWSGTCGAINRGCQKRSMSNMRTLATAIEGYHASFGRYPEVDTNMDALVRVLPAPQGGLPTDDGWGHPLRIRVTPTSYTIVSHGCCGEPDVADIELYAPGPTSRFTADCVFTDGSFFRYPDGIQE